MDFSCSTIANNVAFNVYSISMGNFGFPQYMYRIVMNMNNLAGHYNYDVRTFHATIYKYTRALHVSAATCMVEPTIIRNRIGYTFIRLQGSQPFK